MLTVVIMAPVSTIPQTGRLYISMLMNHLSALDFRIDFVLVVWIPLNWVDNFLGRGLLKPCVSLMLVI